MKKYKLHILYLITLALWFIPRDLKTTFPALFGSNYIQWSIAYIVSLLIPIGSLYSLYWIKKGKKGGYWFFIAFSTPLVVSLFLYAVISPLLLSLQGSQHSIFKDDANTISILLNQIQSSKSKDRARNIARARILYSLYGIKAYMPSDNGNLSIYSPTEDDKVRWQEMQKTKQTALATDNIINWQLKQIPWLFSIFLGNYILIMGIGLGIYSYHKRREHSTKHL